MSIISVVQECGYLFFGQIHDIPQVSDIKEETNAEVAIADRLRHFGIDDLVAVLAISLLDDVFNHEEGYWDDFFLISHPYILQFLELSTAMRASFKLEDNGHISSIRAFA